MKPVVTGVSCSSYKRGERTNCVITGRNFIPGKAWISCLRISSNYKASSTRWRVLGTWVCNCGLNRVEASVTGAATYQSNYSIQMGAARIDKVVNYNVRKGRNQTVYVNGCNLGKLVYIAGVPVSGIVLKANADQVFFNVNVPRSYTGTRGWIRIQVARTSGASCGSFVKACTNTNSSDLSQRGVYVR